MILLHFLSFFTTIFQINFINLHDDYTEIDKITKYITMENKYSLPYDGGIIMDGTPEDILHRYEKIPTTIFSTESTGAEYVADEIVNAINAHECFVVKTKSD